jgi:menaquinone-dependent protoporphyrinogen oxidase
MNRFLIGYATGEGRTAVVAEHIARRLRWLGHGAYLLDVALEDRSRDPLHGCNAVIIVASAHRGRHEPAVIAFVKRNFDQITAWPSAFLSVSRTDKFVESRLANRPQNDRADLPANAAIDAFIEETGWEPGRAKPVPDVLVHTSHGIIVRWLLKGVARATGTAPKRPLEPDVANWDDLDAFVDDLVESLAHRNAPERLDLVLAGAPSRSAC